MRTYFTITQHYPSGFDISIGVGKKFYAKDRKALTKALDHYFRFPTTTGHLGKEAGCPLCEE
jgi:hypothetical protein